MANLHFWINQKHQDWFYALWSSDSQASNLTVDPGTNPWGTPTFEKIKQCFENMECDWGVVQKNGWRVIDPQDSINITMNVEVNHFGLGRK